MSPLKISFTRDGITEEVIAQDNIPAVLRTPAGEVWGMSSGPRFPWIKRQPFKLLADAYLGRHLTARFPGDGEYPWEGTEFGDRPVERARTIATREGTVTIKAVSYPEKK